MGNIVSPKEFKEPVQAIKWNRTEKFIVWLNGNTDKCNVPIQLKGHCGVLRSCLCGNSPESLTLLAVAIYYGRLGIVRELLKVQGLNVTAFLDGKEEEEEHIMMPDIEKVDTAPSLDRLLSTVFQHMQSLRVTGQLQEQFLAEMIEASNGLKDVCITEKALERVMDKFHQVAREYEHYAPLVKGSVERFGLHQNCIGAHGIRRSQEGGEDGKPIQLPKGAVFRHAEGTSDRDQRARTSLNSLIDKNALCLQCAQKFAEKGGHVAAHVILLHPEDFKGLYCLISTCRTCNTSKGSKTNFWTLRESCTAWTIPIAYQDRC